MLVCGLANRPGERRLSTQPLIDHDAQGILIAGGTWFTSELLRGHIGDGPGCLQDRLRTCALEDDGTVKFGEQDFIVVPQQHALRFDVAMDQFLLVDIVQGLGHLPDVGDNSI